ncbi:restriction endonuclease [Streptomyces sp. NPDC001205]
MAISQPARRARKNFFAGARRPVRRSRRRLPRITWGGAAGLALGAFIIAKTYPVPCIVAVTLMAAALILHAVRPVRLSSSLARINRRYARRTALPRQRSLDAFHRMSPGRFEEAVAELATEDPDVISATVVCVSNDRGMDIRVKLVNGIDVLVQCKRYRKGNNVPSAAVVHTNGAYRDLHRCHRAVIVTTSDFTREAQSINATLPQPIRLVSGTELVDWANGGRSPLT